MPIWRRTPADELAGKAIEVKPGQYMTPEECHDLAIHLALKGGGHVSPNPMVGAVAVDAEHRFLAGGAHLQFGGLHAEANLLAALRQKEGFFSEDLIGATFYVTLEPCSHTGKTPSCAKTLSELPIKNLVYASADPNPIVNGQGIQLLRQAGINCVVDANFSEKARFLIDAFSWNIVHKTPWVGLKAAVSLDGAFVKRDRQKFWITSPRSRQFGHWLRHLYDGIMVGSQTVLADNPRLDVRHPSCGNKHPHVFVFDPSGHAVTSVELEKLEMFNISGRSVTWIAAQEVWDRLEGERRKLLEHFQVNLATLPRFSSRWGDGDIREVLQNPLVAHEIVRDISDIVSSVVDGVEGCVEGKSEHPRMVGSILLEGGGGLWKAFVEGSMVNKLHLFQSPQLIGGADGVNWLGGAKIQAPINLTNSEITFLGEDLLIESTVMPGDSSD